ncbi:hypothetical protein UlMin_020770, partial [Ulmus minor]
IVIAMDVIDDHAPKETSLPSIQSALARDSGASSMAASVDSAEPPKSSTSEPMEIINLESSNSDLSYHDDEEDDAIDEDEDDYCYADCDGYDDFAATDEYDKLQSKFDKVDLPPGVEVSVPWLTSDVAETSKKEVTASNSSTVHAESSSNNKVGESVDTTENILQFKQFDAVDDFTDHHYGRLDLSGPKSSQNWAKRIQEEWKSLEESLPETIYVRICEARMELLRAVIVGPAGTPYHDGLFVFDCVFPNDYPNSPPMVYYYSGGLRINPNLYECGKVCLSLLGTWSGKSNENWVPGNSTMLQVLVSIQALILNAKPFYNEPGHESFVGASGERKSKKYNEEAFILSLKTMIYTMRKPPKHFEELVAGHFRQRAHDILIACKAYTEGALVGSNVKDEQDENQNNGSREFRSQVSRLMNSLIARFTENGSVDCEQFRVSA